jgi:gluconolactonase
LLAPGAAVKKVSGEFSFTEGPAVDRHGDVYFTDQPNDRIMKWQAADGSITTFMQPAGRANGMYFDRRGNLIACADAKNELWSISASKEVTVLVKDYQGKLLNGPNDAWVRPDDGIYFTDPLYKRPYWSRGPTEQGGEHVYFLSPNRKTCTRVTDDLKQPNGIIGTPDGKVLYVSDIGAGRTFAYDVNKDGTLKHKRLFCELGSDGMTIDDRGNVYLTGKGVTVFDSSGRKVEHIDIPEPWTANVCFAGPDRRTLFITASKSIYTVRLQNKGLTK